MTRRFAALARCLIGEKADGLFPELRELEGEPSEDQIGRKIAEAFGVSADELEG